MAEQDEQQQPGSFKVSDRRKFTTDGQLRPDVEAEKASATPPSPPPQAAPPQAPSPGQTSAEALAGSSETGAVAAQGASLDEAGAGQEAPLETGMETAFERLVISFTSTAMLQLGLVALDPEQPPEVDLAGARETIDMLGVLEEKTLGNLSAREACLLKNTLAELRMAFVEVQKRKGARR